MSTPSGQINLFDLPIPQLQAVGTQLEEEIQVLTSSFGQLRQAQSKFMEGLESLKRLGPAAKDNKEVLIPLTNSLYVTGTLDQEAEKVIVDVGTGYYAEKTIPQAQDYFKRKIEFVKGNLAKLESSVIERQNQRKILIQVLQTKLAEAQQAQAQAQQQGNDPQAITA